MISRSILAASGLIGLAAAQPADGQCASEIMQVATEYEDKVQALQAKLEAAESKLALRSCPPCGTGGGTLTWTGVVDFLYDTFSLQKSIVMTCYGKVVQPKHEEMIAANIAKAKTVSFETYEAGKGKVGDLYAKHLDKHYQKLAPHVDLVTGKINENVENIQNMYTLHGEGKVNDAKAKIVDGVITGYEKLCTGFSTATQKVDAFLAPKVDAIVQVFPEHAHLFPEKVQDRLFFGTAFIVMTCLYVFFLMKLSGKAICITKCTLKTVFGIAFAIFMFPIRVLTCQVCKKRAGGKQTFSKAPASSNKKKNKKH